MLIEQSKEAANVASVEKSFSSRRTEFLFVFLTLTV